MIHGADYFGLFAVAFLAATVFPAQSEVVLWGMLLSERYQWILLILVASVGNTLGSVVNWFIGRFFAQFEDRRWFPVSREKMARAEEFYRKYGRWSLFLSWAPFIGDPLTVVAGVLRESLPIFILLVGLAKTARYLAVAALSFGWL